MGAATGQWQFWIDRGGTFTDIVACSPDGALSTHKFLSENVAAYEDAALAGIRRCLGLAESAQVPADRIASIKMGTTVATNALLERKGEPTVLVLTKGLTDQLEIGTQARSGIFAKKIEKPHLLYGRVASAPERVRADGTIEIPLDTAALESELAAAFAGGYRAVAFVFMHAYAFPGHERQAAQIAREIGFTQITMSHAVSPLIKIVSRGDTAVADAYLSPVLRRYVAGIEAAIRPNDGSHQTGPGILLMASSGGLKPARQLHGCEAVLSGPAGGVVAMAEIARHLGYERVIGFDMGGTSTDVSHFAGTYERTFENEVAGVRLRVPMLKVETVAAGGGSIIVFDGDRLRVGPESAGANPGPQCYRRGGPLTVTDANVMLGKLQPEYFPHVFGPNGDAPIDTTSITESFNQLAERVGGGRSGAAVADGCVRIAVENMANAIKKISVGRGHDVTKYALQCFGSAGGQHACLIADTLQIETVIIHPLSGLLSAYGMGLAALRASREQSLEMAFTAGTLDSAEELTSEMGAAAEKELRESGVPVREITHTANAHLRYEGSDSALPVAMGPFSSMCEAFHYAHRQRFGFASRDKKLFIATLEVEATGGGAKLNMRQCEPASPAVAPEAAVTRFHSGGRWHDAKAYLRTALFPGHRVNGPSLIIEPHQTIVVERNWTAEVSPENVLILSRVAPRKREVLSAKPDPVMLEVFNNHFMAIAEQMGEALRNTAQSVNIKERLDFSCALFDGEAQLVANAPHVPVHLGSMDRAVEAIIECRHGRMKDGETYMLNAPYGGGTHLPDITVVTPVFDTLGKEINFFVASRGHHADIGGISPGSMSPNTSSIAEEGVLIEDFLLVSDGEFREQAVRDLLAGAMYPARSPSQNIADLKAQVAANARGAEDVKKMIAHFGLDVVTAYMRHVQDNAEDAVRRLLSRLDDGHFRVTTDQSTAIEVSVKVDRARRAARIDFTGSSPQQPTNFNAPEPVTRAAVLYVIRVLLEEPIPINAGCLWPIELVIPDGSMLSPRYPAAVAAGNVETSQIVTNALFAAFGAMASSQGTMNNLTFGNAHFQYYETICSGSPAGPGFDGTASVQVHMTNTRLTDPEILELRYPVVVEEFAIMRGSGGRGRWSSGDGTRRVIRFLSKMDCAILSGYRSVPPFGLAGGHDGQRGRNLVRRKDGRVENIPGCAQLSLDAGDAIIIETPTGGGFGTPIGGEPL